MIVERTHTLPGGGGAVQAVRVVIACLALLIVALVGYFLTVVLSWFVGAVVPMAGWGRVSKSSSVELPRPSLQVSTETGQLQLQDAHPLTRLASGPQSRSAQQAHPADSALGS